MKKRKVLFLVLLDIIAINYSYILALFFRFETNIPEKFLDISIRHILIITAIKIAIFYIFKLYSSIWEYASIDELMEIVVSVILANIFVSVYVILSNMNYSRSLFFIIPIIDLFFIGGIRFLFR
ncbi:MAG: polysaccharide biosynthesis protein, partial [Clostridiales bacterium]|nr:polysaccharide biosynthesis protein [Clostridiales bacterium]